MVSSFVVLALLLVSGTLVTSETLNFKDEEGKEHEEEVDVDGDIERYSDWIDGFIVTLDFGNKVLLIKNTTSNQCIYSHLDESIFTRGSKKAVLVEGDDSNSALKDTLNALVFSKQATMPDDLKDSTKALGEKEGCHEDTSFFSEADTSEAIKRWWHWGRCRKIRIHWGWHWG